MRVVRDRQPQQRPRASLETSTMVFPRVYLKALRMKEDFLATRPLRVPRINWGVYPVWNDRQGASVPAR